MVRFSDLLGGAEPPAVVDPVVAAPPREPAGPAGTTARAPSPAGRASAEPSPFAELLGAPVPPSAAPAPSAVAFAPPPPPPPPPSPPPPPPPPPLSQSVVAMIDAGGAPAAVPPPIEPAAVIERVDPDPVPALEAAFLGGRPAPPLGTGASFADVMGGPAATQSVSAEPERTAVPDAVVGGLSVLPIDDDLLPRGKRRR